MTPIVVDLLPDTTSEIETPSLSPFYQYSGIVLNQNQLATSFLTATGVWHYQEFLIPDDYERGADDSEIEIPELSGFQILAGTFTGGDLSFDWTFDYYKFGTGWTTLAFGTTVGSQADAEKVWLDTFFDSAVNISGILDSRFRIGFKDNAQISKFWYTAPNPLTLSSRLYIADGTTPVTDGGNDVSILFRVLALVADGGVDFLGSTYRSVVKNASLDNVDPLNGNRNAGWMSAPLPSRFATTSLYFDVRPAQPNTYVQNGPNWDPLANDPQDVGAVIDKVLLDPLTPGIYFNIYYTDEGVPGKNDADWDNKLWKHVSRTYHAVKRENHVLPEPIIAKYIKIEFCHLQAQSYNPGDFPRPIKYKKHPKWVLDYFLARTTAQKASDDRLLASTVSIIYDTLDIAYNYYLDDLAQEPDKPIEIDPAYTSKVTQFIDDKNDLSDQVDSLTLTKINLALAPYQQHPALFAKDDYLLGAYSKQVAAQLDYPVESATAIDFPDVQELRNENVIFESDFPVMFFYLTCRHKYREVIAEFSHNRAYFAGVREIAFTRELFTLANDASEYQEPGGDLVNTTRNDFVRVDGQMVIE